MIDIVTLFCLPQVAFTLIFTQGKVFEGFKHWLIEHGCVFDEAQDVYNEYWIGKLPKFDLGEKLTYFLNCPMCLGFWVGLISTYSFNLALVISLLSYVIGSIMEYLKLSTIKMRGEI